MHQLFINISGLLLMSPQNGEGGSMSTMIFLGAIFVIMYFFMIRPQVKKAKDQKKFIENLQKGDEIITSGGIYGRIVNINDTYLMVEIAPNVKIKVDKATIAIPAAPGKK